MSGQNRSDRKHRTREVVDNVVGRLESPHSRSHRPPSHKNSINNKPIIIRQFGASSKPASVMDLALRIANSVNFSYLSLYKLCDMSKKLAYFGILA